MEKKYNKLRSEIETSNNQEIKEQLRLNNTALMSTIDQSFSVFQTVMLQTIKDLVQSLIISTNQNNTTQPNTSFTHDQSNSNPTHNQTSNIHPSSIIHPQHQLQYNQTNLNTNQLNNPIITPHQQQTVYANVSQQFQHNSANPTYQ